MAQQEPARYTGETLPAWSLPAAAAEQIALGVEWPQPVTREWAWGGSTGEGVRVCIVDSGIEPDHPRVGRVHGSHVAGVGEDGEVAVEADEAVDVSGHGTACAGVVRALAPGCELHSVRVLGPEATGSGKAL